MTTQLEEDLRKVTMGEFERQVNQGLVVRHIISDEKLMPRFVSEVRITIHPNGKWTAEA